MASLIVTNGSAAVNSIVRIRPADRYLPWDDVLHAGPVPGELSLQKLSQIRARFIYRCGWGEEEEILKRFQKRDEVLLTAHENFDELILWFENDLYDQLQLIQILSVLAGQKDIQDSRLPITLICHDHLVGMSATEILLRDHHERTSVIPAQYKLATEAWSAFTHFSPQKLESLLITNNFSYLPFLRAAILRWFDEFPNAYDGLSSTERTVLHCISKGVHDAVELFAAIQEIEEAPFLGDLAFWRILHQMSTTPSRLISTRNGEPYNPQDGAAGYFNLTDQGEQALSGIIVDSRRKLDRWLGGVHIRPGSGWYWNHINETFENDLVA